MRHVSRHARSARRSTGWASSVAALGAALLVVGLTSPASSADAAPGAPAVLEQGAGGADGQDPGDAQPSTTPDQPAAVAEQGNGDQPAAAAGEGDTAEAASTESQESEASNDGGAEPSGSDEGEEPAVARTSRRPARPRRRSSRLRNWRCPR